jgi:hypothetical protein
LVQIGLLAGQVSLLQQSPVKHCPPQQTLPAPHWSLVVQAPQTWFVQMGLLGSLQSGLPQQLPVTHCPSQQTFPSPHCWLVVQGTHCPWPLQIGLAGSGQSPLVQHPLHVPRQQVGVLGGQATQLTPPVPQWALVLVWQVPFWQHPFGQLVGVHGATHLPLEQIWPLGQQTLPAPHC